MEVSQLCSDRSEAGFEISTFRSPSCAKAAVAAVIASHEKIAAISLVIVPSPQSA
jgi:hypothetical protein